MSLNYAQFVCGLSQSKRSKSFVTVSEQALPNFTRPSRISPITEFWMTSVYISKAGMVLSRPKAHSCFCHLVHLYKPLWFDHRLYVCTTTVMGSYTVTVGYLSLIHIFSTNRATPSALCAPSTITSGKTVSIRPSQCVYTCCYTYNSSIVAVAKSSIAAVLFSPISKRFICLFFLLHSDPCLHIFHPDR